MIRGQDQLESKPRSYRTLDWNLSSAICRAYEVEHCTGCTPLDSNPIFPSFGWEQEVREGTFFNLVFAPKSAISGLLPLLHKCKRWVALLPHQIRGFPGRQEHAFAPEDRVWRRKSWWRTGDTSLCKAKKRLLLWISKDMRGNFSTFEGLWKFPHASPLPRNREPPRLQQYLDSQSGGKYRHVEGHLMACDGALRKVGPHWKMGGGGVLRGRQDPLVSVKIGSAYGKCSSLRAELGALTGSLLQAPRQGHLTILDDSLCLCQLLLKLRRQDFRPPWSKLKEKDILRDLAKEVSTRRAAGQRISIIHVHSHGGMMYNDKADEIATAAATHGQEAWTDLDNIGGMRVTLLDENQQPSDTIMPWCLSTIRELNNQAARWYMQKARAAPSRTETFLLRDNQGRQCLGEALRKLWDWDATEALLSIGFQTRTRVFLFGDTGNCPRCPGCKETYDHIQFICPPLQGARQTAHNMVAESVQQGLEPYLQEDVVQGWDQTVCTTLSRRDLGQAGKMKPDGLILNPTKKQIFIVEIARTSDDRDHFEALRGCEKERHYHALSQSLVDSYPGYEVQRVTFIVGARGSIKEDTFRRNLSCLGIPLPKHDKIMERVVRAALQASCFVMRAYKKLG